MAQTYQTADGKTLVRGPQGGWREASEQEAAILAEGTTEAIAQSAGQNLRVTGGLLQSLSGIIGGGGVAGRRGQEMIIERGLETVSDATQNLEARAFARPEATAAGALVGGLTEEVLTGGAIGLTAMGKRALTDMASTYARNRATRTAATRAANAVPDVSVTSPDAKAFNDLMADLPQANVDTGAAQVTKGADGAVNTVPTPEGVETLAGLSNVPRWRDVAMGVAEKIGKGSGLSADQARLISNGTVARTGFRLFPGQASGSNVAVDVAETIPQFAEVFSPILNNNGRLLGEKVARSVGLDANAVGRDILSESRAAVGQMFDNVEAAIRPVTLGDDMVKQLNDVLSTSERELFDLGNGPQSGNDLMEVRSLINSELSAERKLAAEGKRARQLETTLDQYDDIIAESFDDPAMKAKWSEARQRWRMVLALDKPGVIGPDGEISLKRLTGAMERQFPNEFRRKLTPGAEKLPADMVDLMEYTRVARSFASNLPNSGTATRNLFAKAATHPAVYGPLAGAGLWQTLFGD